MATGKGTNAVMGVKKEAAFGTEIIVTKAVPLVSEDFGDDTDYIADEVLRGKAGAGDDDEGNSAYPFTIKAKLTYEDLDFLVAHAMGTAGTPVTNGSLKDNTYSLAEEITTSFTNAIYKGVSVWTFAGCKANTMTISGKANQPLDIEFGGWAHSRTLASALNTAAVLQALSTESAGNKVMFTDLTFKIAAQATALSGVTELGIGGFSLKLDNKLKGDDFDNTSTNNLEPLRDSKRQVGLDIDVPRYDADTYVAWKSAKTALHAELSFTAGSYKFAIGIPRLFIQSVAAPVSGPGLIQQAVKCVCRRDPSSASATFTDLNEFTIAVTNAVATSPLA